VSERPGNDSDLVLCVKDSKKGQAVQLQSLGVLLGLPRTRKQSRGGHEAKPRSLYYLEQLPTPAVRCVGKTRTRISFLLNLAIASPITSLQALSIPTSA
jgi:hypothetical protein